MKLKRRVVQGDNLELAVSTPKYQAHTQNDILAVR